jgi:hypothetical protein
MPPDALDLERGLTLAPGHLEVVVELTVCPELRQERGRRLMLLSSLFLSEHCRSARVATYGSVASNRSWHSEQINR